MLTMRDPIEHARRQYGGRTAVIDGERALSYAELATRTARLGSALREFGLRPGDRVAVLAANGHRYLEAFLGIPAAGMIFVPLNTRLSERELLAIIEDASPRLLLCDREPGRLEEMVERVIHLSDQYDGWIQSVGESSAPSVGEEDVAALFYTGGTTGKSKGVALTHRNLVSNAMHKVIACSLTENDRFLAVAPMFHVAGVAPLVGLTWLGAQTVTVPAFDPDACLDVIARHALTVMMPVPTMLAALAEAQVRRPRAIESLRMVGHAGSSITKSTIEAAHAAFPKAELAQFYGATETASIVTCQRNEQSLIGTPLLGTCGRAVVGVAVRTVRDDGTDCEPREVGEILVRGPNVMGRYWNDPEASAEALEGGWYHTGDLGFLVHDGHLFVVDRKKDMIISGAENVYSVEVEDALVRHSAVIEAAVFGVPDPKWGEAVHAIVVVREGLAKDPDALASELRAHCRSYIAGYKVPKHIDVQMAPLPKSGPGKILKRALRDRFWTDTSPRAGGRKLS